MAVKSRKKIFAPASTSGSGINSATQTALDAKVSKSGDSMTGALNEAKGADIASASTTNIGAATGNYVHITGTTTITSFGTVQAGTERTLEFDGSLTLTHNATSLILPGGVNIQTAAGDTAIFRSEGSGNWRCIFYQTASDSYTNYVPALTGNSVDPPLLNARWKMLTRNTCHVIVTFSTVGTSNATTKTITFPFNASSTSIQHIAAVGRDNGTDTSMNLRTRTGSNIVDIFKVFNTVHTASGNWSCCISAVYHIDI